MTIVHDGRAWLIRVAGPRAECDLIRACLSGVVGEYRRVGDEHYRVAGHREPTRRRFAAHVRAQGGSVAWDDRRSGHGRARP